MTAHIPDEVLESFLSRRLKSPELLALDDHLQACGGCRERLRELKLFDNAITALRADVAQDVAATTHLTRAQITGYVEDRLYAVDRELAEGHAEFCSACTVEIQRMRETPDTQMTGVAPRRKAVWRKSSFAVLRLLSWPAGAAAALAALFLVTWVPLREHTEKRNVAKKDPGLSTSLTPSPAILVALKDGGPECSTRSNCVLVTLNEQGALGGLDFLSPSEQQHVRTALTTRKFAIAAVLRDLKQSSSSVMGPDEKPAFALLAPLENIIASDQPTFLWKPLAGAEAYKVTITDPATGYTEIASSPELRETRWTIDRRLPRGRVYSWQVTARTAAGEVKAPTPQQGEAKFQVLEQAKADELAKSERTYPGHHLVLGTMYAQAGLLDKAAEHFRALVAANPGSIVASDLLRSVLSLQRASKPEAER